MNVYLANLHNHKADINLRILAIERCIAWGYNEYWVKLAIAHAELILVNAQLDRIRGI